MAGNFPVPWLHDLTPNEIRSFISSTGHCVDWGATTHQVHGSSWCDDNEANTPLWNSVLSSILIGELIFSMASKKLMVSSFAGVISFLLFWQCKNDVKGETEKKGTLKIPNQTENCNARETAFCLDRGNSQCHTSATVCLWLRPFAAKLRRRITKSMRSRIAKTSKEVTMVKKAMKNGRMTV